MKIKTKLRSCLKATLLLLTILCFPAKADALVFQVDGIFYSTHEDDPTTVSVATSGEVYDAETNEYVNVHHNVSGSVTIPSTVTYNGFTYTVTGIEGMAFSHYSALTDISIPETVTEIGTGAFDETGLWEQQQGIIYADKWAVGCKGYMSLDPIIKEGTIGIANHAFDVTRCSPFNNAVVIPNSVLYIGQGAFITLFGCASPIKSITIGENVQLIRAGAFYTGSECWTAGSLAGQVNLQQITCLAKVPPRTTSVYGAQGAFAGLNEYCEKHGGWTEIYEDNDYAIYNKVPLAVPFESVEAYKNAPDWSRFKTIIAIISYNCDVNGDNEVTVSDINAVVDVITKGPSHPNYNNCDVNEDGEVSVADINLIVDAIVGD